MANNNNKNKKKELFINGNKNNNNSYSSSSSSPNSAFSPVNCIHKQTMCCQNFVNDSQDSYVDDNIIDEDNNYQSSSSSSTHSHQQKHGSKVSLKRSFFKNLKAISSSLSHSSSLEGATTVNDNDHHHHHHHHSSKRYDKKPKETSTKSFDQKESHNNKAIPSSTSNHHHNRINHHNHNRPTSSLLSVNWSNLDYDEEDFAEAFRVFDTNGDGCITGKELHKVLTELGIKITDDEIKTMINELDKDGNGTIEYSEFVQMMTQPASREADEYELREAFKCIDLDGNGYISKDELRKAVRKIMSTDKKISLQDVEEMMIEADQDGNGLIDFDEFVRILVDKRS